MKEKIVYKSMLLLHGKLVSLIEYACLIVYTPNKWIKPKIGKIFTFDSQESAIDFCFMPSIPGITGKLLIRPIQIWKALGKNPSIMENMCSTYRVGDIEKFWNGELEDSLKSKSPESTVVVDEIKLLERVTIM